MEDKDPVETFFIEVEKAWYRTGPTQEKAMDWALRFANQDLDMLSSGQFTDLAFEIVAFVLFGPPGGSPSFADQKVGFEYTGWYKSQMEAPSCPTPEEAKKMQNMMRMHLDDYLDKGSTSLVIPQLKVFIGQASKTGAISRVLVASTDRLQQFEFHFVTLLARYAHGVRRCDADDCLRYLLQKRKAQRFCTVRCQSRIAMRERRPPSQRKPHQDPQRFGGQASHSRKEN